MYIIYALHYINSLRALLSALEHQDSDLGIAIVSILTENYREKRLGQLTTMKQSIPQNRKF